MRDIFLALAAGCAALLIESAVVRILAWLLRPRGVRKLVLLPIEGDCPDLEARIRWQLFCMRQQAYCPGQWLLLVDCGASPQALELARTVSAEQPRTILCGKDKLRGIIGHDLVYKELEIVLY